jgi:hypothetical protein
MEKEGIKFCIENILNNVEDKLNNNLRRDEYVNYGDTAYLTEKTIKRCISELRDELKEEINKLK